MIQFSGHADGGKRYVGIGLSAENLRRLRNGDPAVIDLTPHGYPDSEIIIFYGRTEDEMEAVIKANFTVGTQ